MTLVMTPSEGFLFSALDLEFPKERDFLDARQFSSSVFSLPPSFLALSLQSFECSSSERPEFRTFLIDPFHCL